LAGDSEEGRASDAHDVNLVGISMTGDEADALRVRARIVSARHARDSLALRCEPCRTRSTAGGRYRLVGFPPTTGPGLAYLNGPWGRRLGRCRHPPEPERVVGTA